MSKNNNTSTSCSISATGLLGIAFIILKLCHVIEWSWWWVLAPFWVPFAIAIIIIAIDIVWIWRA